MTIQEMCNEKRIALGLTHQNIADQAEMPLQTVRNFFSRASKAPSIYTTAQICAVLGVSLDEFFGIAERLTQEETHVADLQSHIVDQESTIQDLRPQYAPRNFGVRLRGNRPAGLVYLF